jgi:hypothetical protein
VEVSRQRRTVGEEIITVAGVWLGFSLNLDNLKRMDYTQAELSRFLNRYKSHLATLSTDYNSIMIH